MIDDEQCPDCDGEGTPLPEGADHEDYSRCGNCKGWYESTSDAMDALSESMNPTETDNLLRCQECNSTQVHVAMWVDANTSEKFDDVFPLDPWCCDCEDHVKIGIPTTSNKRSTS